MRYYEPILDDVPGVQCQVDPGELRGVLIGGEERTLHFVVFVLSYSRLMYVGMSFRPLDAQCFIQLHDEALLRFEFSAEVSLNGIGEAGAGDGHAEDGCSTQCFCKRAGFQSSFVLLCHGFLTLVFV